MSAEKAIVEILHNAYMKGLGDIQATPLNHKVIRNDVTIYLSGSCFKSLMRGLHNQGEIDHRAYEFYNHPEKMGGYKVFVVHDDSHPDYVIHAKEGTA